MESSNIEHQNLALGEHPLSLVTDFEEVSLSQRVDLFEVATRDLLKKRELLDRVDRKFLTSTAHVAEFLQMLEGKYAILTAKGTRWAQYETCYFDTPNLDSFHEHLRGRRPRYKVRIRHHVARERSYLEVKRKCNNGKTVKSRIKRAFGDNELSSDDKAFIGQHCPYDPEQLKISVWTNFRRATLVGLETNERITIDLGLTFEREAMVKNRHNLAIVELKQPRLTHTSPAARALHSLGVREASMSKYCAAVADLHRGARERARRTMLRRLERMFE